VVDQLNVEKRGIPTVTITTTAFEEMFRAGVKDQGSGELSAVVVEHPIAGHNLDGIRKKADAALADVIKAATKWQPSGK
jgi:hypothetical protein